MHEFVAENRDKVELFLDESKLHEVLHRKKPTKYFWCDMTDMFLDDHPFEWIDKCFATMALTPQHTHQILTKRPERMREYWQSIRVRMDAVLTQAVQMSGRKYSIDDFVHRASMPLPNVWLGVSCENQETYAQRWPVLRQIDASVRFLSLEPLLDGIYLRLLSDHPIKPDWAIIGGESGPNARPCDLRGVRRLISECEHLGIACFVKQLGRMPTDCMWFRPEWPEHVTYTNDPVHGLVINLNDSHGSDWEEWQEKLKVREFPKQA